MGAGIVCKASGTEKILISGNRIEFLSPDNEKSGIGKFLLTNLSEEEKTSEKDSLKVWNRLLGSYKSLNPIEELLKDTKRFRILNDYIRSGVPMQWRWALWKNYMNVLPLSKSDYQSIQIDSEITGSVISKDIDRTFPEHFYFDKAKFGYVGQFALLRILGKFARVYPEIGYCQGMNFIVGVFLLVSGGNEIESFGMFDAILHHFDIRDFYSENMPKLKVYLSEFDDLFLAQCKSVYWHFQEKEISSDMWILKWYLTLFAAVLPLKVLVNVWDLLMVDGISILSKTAISILKYFEKDLLEKDSFEILDFFNNLKYLDLAPEKILQNVVIKKSRPKTITKIFPFNHPRTNEGLSQCFDDIEIEETTPTKVMVNCEITEDPKLLPFARTHRQAQKNYRKIKYRSSLNFEEGCDGSTMVEESRPDDYFDANVILNDLITEEFE